MTLKNNPYVSVEDMDDRYVSKDYCNNKKQKYISKEVCEERLKQYGIEVKAIHNILQDIKDNHIAHMQYSLEKMQEEITEIKIKVAVFVAISTIIIQIIFHFI